MFHFVLAAAMATQPVSANARDAGPATQGDGAGLTVVTGSQQTDDPAKLINLGVAYARSGDLARARAMFRAAHTAPERVELETASGEWVYSRVLARRGLAMLGSGDASRIGALALK